jgi:hypothetical protein
MVLDLNAAHPVCEDTSTLSSSKVLIDELTNLHPSLLTVDRTSLLLILLKFSNKKWGWLNALGATTTI